MQSGAWEPGRVGARRRCWPRALGAAYTRAVKRLALAVFVALVVWQVYSQYRAGAFASLTPAGAAAQTEGPSAGGDFKCDARTHCAQMTSCAEAKFFHKNCRDADLEVDSAGVPCPRRWCTSPTAP